MKGMYECKTCGVVTPEKEHLCSPQKLSGKSDYCGESPESSANMCDTMQKGLEYECGQCGRPTEDPGMVCQPEKRH